MQCVTSRSNRPNASRLGRFDVRARSLCVTTRVQRILRCRRIVLSKPHTAYFGSEGSREYESLKS